VIYLEGDATIIRLNSTEAAVSFLFLTIFHLNIFERVMAVFCGVGGVQK